MEILDVEISSNIFTDEEKLRLILQEDYIFCFDKESEGIREIPRVALIDENNNLRVNEET